VLAVVPMARSQSQPLNRNEDMNATPFSTNSSVQSNKDISSAPVGPKGGAGKMKSAPVHEKSSTANAVQIVTSGKSAQTDIVPDIQSSEDAA